MPSRLHSVERLVAATNRLQVLLRHRPPSIPFDLRFANGERRAKPPWYDPLGEVTEWRDTSSLVVSLQSKAGDVAQPSQLLVNDEARKGSTR